MVLEEVDVEGVVDLEGVAVATEVEVGVTEVEVGVTEVEEEVSYIAT